MPGHAWLTGLVVLSESDLWKQKPAKPCFSRRKSIRLTPLSIPKPAKKRASSFQNGGYNTPRTTPMPSRTSVSTVILARLPLMPSDLRVPVRAESHPLPPSPSTLCSAVTTSEDLQGLFKCCWLRNWPSNDFRSSLDLQIVRQHGRRGYRRL